MTAGEPISVRCFLAGCCSNLLSVKVSPPLLGNQLVGAIAHSLDSGKRRDDTLYSSTPTSVTGKAKAMEMTGPWGQRVALSQGWPWQTSLKPELLRHCDCMAHTVRGSEKDLLNCSRL